MANSHRPLALLVAGALAACFASPADAAVSGRGWERAALQWQAQGRFDSAAYGFQKAADAFAAEGDGDAKIRALREAATANEQYADHLMAGGAKAAAPIRTAPAPAPAPVQRQVAPAAGGALPPGHYVCLFASGGSPGAVDIRGGAYRGPSLEPSGAFAPYSMGAGNRVTWSRGFGEFNVVSTEYRGISNDSAHSPWFTVTYNRTRGGGVDSVDCERE